MLHTENYTQANFTPKRFESDHEIVLRGQTIPYHTVSEDNVFYDAAGKPIASIFSYSYFRSDVENPVNRPVLFAYNGGPGSSCMYIHAGMMGTKRLKYDEVDRKTALPPYEVIDNPDCLLDVADIVVIDPVATGYGLLLDESYADKFFGIEEDAESILQFIEMWMNRYNRFLSPKYLVGESYGCTRSAVVAGIAATGGKERGYGFGFDGIVMIGNTVTTGKYYNREVPAEDSVLGFPTYAAVNWYHKHPTDQTVEEFVKEARAFADHDYVLALHQGSSLDDAEKERIIEKVCYYTGVSREYLIRQGLRIDDDNYRQEVLKKEGKAVGRYDGRLTRPLYEPEITEIKDGLWDDATSDHYGPYFFNVMNGAILPYLNVKLDRQYISSKRTNWNEEASRGTTAQMLNRAMHRVIGMRTMFANGWFDLCTELGIIYYMLNHANLPMDRVSLKCYPSGHMIYLGEENIHALCEDIREFIQK